MSLELGGIISNFTTKVTPPSTIITLEEDSAGRVDIIAGVGDRQTWRIASIGDGKLHVFKFNQAIARQLGLALDDQGYLVVARAALLD